jgi:hypothetical protein
MNVKIVKLVTGEEIVAEVNISDKDIVLKNPQKFMLTAEGLASMPLMPLSKDKEYTIPLHHVILTAEPEDDIKNAYNSQYGSGIVVAKNIIT